MRIFLKFSQNFLSKARPKRKVLIDRQQLQDYLYLQISLLCSSLSFLLELRVWSSVNLLTGTGLECKFWRETEDQWLQVY